MKKLKLNLANLQGTEVLTREQLKKVVGGTLFSCQCSETGYWTGNYETPQAIIDAINTYCPNCGTCVNQDKS